MKTRLALFLLLTISTIAHAQFIPDVSVNPDPLDSIKTSFEPVLKKPARSCVYLVKKDTLYKVILDETGRETLRITYSKNKPVDTLVHKFDKTGSEVLYHRNSQYPNKDSQKYKYDKNGNAIEWQRIGYGAIHWYFEYDSKNRLIKRYTVGEVKANEKDRVSDYIYDKDGNLTEVAEKQWVTRYEYSNKLLIAKTKYYTNDNRNDANNFKRYSYDEGGRPTKTVNNFDSVTYFYEGNMLKRMVTCVKKDTNYEEVVFFYDKSLLQKAEITTTAFSSNPWFIFRSEYLTGKRSDGKISKRKMEFFYDKKNNIKEVKYFVEGDYKYSKEFIYEYY